MKNKPLISIITASYNYAQYLPETIQSVLEQTYDNWELIIVDDGSKDNSVEVIKKYCAKDSRIHLYQHEDCVNKGLSATVQLGLEKANGEWVAFLEADDIFESDCLEEKVKVLNKNSEVEFIFSDLTTFGDGGICGTKSEWNKKIKKSLKGKNSLINLSYEFINKNLITTFSVVMLKKYLLLDCDFDSPVKTYLDYWLWIQISRKTKFYYLNKPLTLWRVHADSYINNKSFDYSLFENEKQRFYKGDIFAEFLFILRKLKQFKQSVISVKIGKIYYLKICNKTLIGNDKK